MKYMGDSRQKKMAQNQPPPVDEEEGREEKREGWERESARSGKRFKCVMEAIVLGLVYISLLILYSSRLH